MKAIFTPLMLLVGVGCSSHCRDPILVYTGVGYHYDCKMECHTDAKPDGFECRCTKSCSCRASHPIKSH